MLVHDFNKAYLRPRDLSEQDAADFASLRDAVANGPDFKIDMMPERQREAYKLAVKRALEMHDPERYATELRPEGDCDSPDLALVAFAHARGTKTDVHKLWQRRLRVVVVANFN